MLRVIIFPLDELIPFFLLWGFRSGETEILPGQVLHFHKTFADDRRSTTSSWTLIRRKITSLVTSPYTWVTSRIAAAGAICCAHRKHSTPRTSNTERISFPAHIVNTCLMRVIAPYTVTLPARTVQSYETEQGLRCYGRWWETIALTLCVAGDKNNYAIHFWTIMSSFYLNYSKMCQQWFLFFIVWHINFPVVLQNKYETTHSEHFIVRIFPVYSLMTTFSL